LDSIQQIRLFQRFPHIEKMNWMIRKLFCKIKSVRKTVLAVRKIRGRRQQFGGADNRIRDVGYKWTYTEKQTNKAGKTSARHGCFFPFFGKKFGNATIIPGFPNFIFPLRETFL
jgi:hypothetical protein